MALSSSPYGKGDLVLLDDKEAERLLNLGAVRALPDRAPSPRCNRPRDL